MSTRKQRTLGNSPTSTKVTTKAASTLQSLDSLQDDLDIQTMKFMEFTPQEQRDIFLHKVKELAATEIVEKSMQVGENMQHFSCKDAYGKTVNSSSLLAKGPLIVTFFRGNWCAYCNLQLRSLQRIMPEILAKGATLVALSPQDETSSLKSVQQGELEYPVLLDRNNQVARQFRIAHDLDPVIRKLYFDWGIQISAFNQGNTDTLPLAATYVIDTNGKVVYSFVDCEPNRRAEPVEILNAIPEPIKRSRGGGIRYVLRSRLRNMVTNMHDSIRGTQRAGLH